MSTDQGHYYTKYGQPMHFVPKRDGNGNRPTTIADCRKMGLLPSVTQIIRILDKPALTEWRINQAVLAVLTTPKIVGEPEDEFVKRVLQREQQQEQESEQAKTIGKDIHDAIELALNAHTIPDGMAVYVEPVLKAVEQFGPVVSTETVIVGQGYAGKYDLLAGDPNVWTLVDFKTSRKIPKVNRDGKAESWPEHRLQLAAYAAAYQLRQPTAKFIKTANIYISTTEPGKIALAEQFDWKEAFEQGFLPVFKAWQYFNKYTPAA